MGKKRFDRGMRSSVQGQITIFIILGIVLFFIFLFVMYLVSSVQKNQMESEREKVFTRALEKEALRLYVQDCTSDALVQGIQLLGKQGRIWVDQGGVQEFAEGVNGVRFGEDRVAYGIVRDDYKSYGEPPEKYPCPPGEGVKVTPFCSYSHIQTDSSIVFGRKKIWLSTAERDLQQYLHEATIHCMEHFLKSNISQAAKLDSEGLELTVGMLDDGVSIKVHYPLRFSIGAEEFFHLSEFDFFFSTKFKQLLDVAVLQPLDQDWTKVDFAYNDQTLKNQPSTFTEKYTQFGIQFLTHSLDNGDAVFEFKPTWDEEKLRDLVLRVARQNRPPALDYISRCPGGDYDYLVVPNRDDNLGKVVINPVANDPDENTNLIYTFINSLQIKQPPNTFEISN